MKNKEQILCMTWIHRVDAPRQEIRSSVANTLILKLFNDYFLLDLQGLLY